MKTKHSSKTKFEKGVLLHALFIFLCSGCSFVLRAQNEGFDEQDETPYVSSEAEGEGEQYRTFRVGFDIGVYGGWLDGLAAPSAEAASAFSEAAPELTAGVQSQIVALIQLDPKLALRPFTGIQIMDSRIEYSRPGFNGRQRVPVLQSAATLGMKIMYGNFNELRGPCISAGGSVMFNINPEQTDRINTLGAVPCFDVAAGWPLKMGNSKALIEAFYGITLSSLIESETLHEQWWDQVVLHKIGVRLAVF